MDVAHLPTVLGEDLPERIQKWIAYKKQGLAIFDSSQEGAQVINQTFSGFDDTVKAPSIQAIQMAIESIEQQASSITGVFREKLGGIQQRDAVSNVKVGVNQSTLLTKQYFHAMDLMYGEVNYDLLNWSKIVYKDGIQGTLILGNRLSKIFTALPEHYTMTDFNIHIQDSSDAAQAKQTMEQAGIELVRGGQANASMLIDIALSKNVRELKNNIEDAVAQQKAENDQIQQLSQQLQQMQQQAKDMQQQLEQAQQENEKLKKAAEKNSQDKLDIERQKVEIDRQTMLNQRDYNDKIANVKQTMARIELLQLKDGNPYNDDIKNL